MFKSADTKVFLYAALANVVLCVLGLMVVDLLPSSPLTDNSLVAMLRVNRSALVSSSVTVGLIALVAGALARQNVL